MKRKLTTLALGASLFAGSLLGLAASAQAADVSIGRLDCGTSPPPVVANERFSDTYAFPGLKLTFEASKGIKGRLAATNISLAIGWWSRLQASEFPYFDHPNRWE